MQRVKMKKDHSVFVKGMSYIVENNKAHYLIDKGYAKLDKGEKEIEKPTKNKMVNRKKNKVRIK